MIRVRVVAEQERVRAALVARLGAEHVVVEPAAITEAEGDALMDQVLAQRHALEGEGVFLSGGSHNGDGVEVSYFAADQTRAEALLRERFGEAIRPRHEGAGLHRFRPFPFASWHAEERRLHVFYALPLNGERPGGCLAHETDDSVTVALMIKDWRGWKTLVGGFTHPTPRSPWLDRWVVASSSTTAPTEPARTGPPSRAESSGRRGLVAAVLLLGSPPTWALHAFPGCGVG